MSRLSFGLLIVACAFSRTFAGESSRPANEEAVVRAGIQSYVAAYNRADAKAVADFWDDQGEWLSPTGERLKGREAIQKGLERLFKDTPGLRLEVTGVKVRLISPDVAVEEGTARIVRPGQPPAASTYLAIQIKRHGRWKLDSVRETEIPGPTESQAEPLQDLAWMVGQWIDQDDQGRVETSVTWTKNRRFLCSSFKVSSPGMDELEGTQVIGWDPAAKTIRSWVFDSDGGFGEGVWTRKGNRWVVKSTMVLPDGRKASATHVYTCIDPNRYTWQSIGRQVDGQFLSNLDEVTVVRKQAATPGAAPPP